MPMLDLYKHANTWACAVTNINDTSYMKTFIYTQISHTSTFKNSRYFRSDESIMISVSA